MKNKNIANNIFKYILIFCLTLISIASFYLFAKIVEAINLLNSESVYNLETNVILSFEAIFYFCLAISCIIGLILTCFSIIKSYETTSQFEKIDYIYDQITTTTCKKCGRKLKPDDKFCPNCGEENKPKNNN